MYNETAYVKGAHCIALLTMMHNGVEYRLTSFKALYDWQATIFARVLNYMFQHRPMAVIYDGRSREYQ